MSSITNIEQNINRLDKNEGNTMKKEKNSFEIHYTKDSEMIKSFVNKNLKIKSRSWVTYIFTFIFPVMFTFLLYAMFGSQEIAPGWRIFDIYISGMFIYAGSSGLINAAISLADEKAKGTLVRLDTTPLGRKNLFLGTLISESIVLMIQLLIMFIVGYGILGLKWHEYNVLLLIFGYFIALLYGLSTLGIGVIISAIAKTPEAANGISMMYMMPVLYLSGAFGPFASNIQYILPPFWAFSLYRQVIIFGHNFWTGYVQISSSNPFIEEYISIPLWGAFTILIAILIITLWIGIKLFQKKTIQ